MKRIICFILLVLQGGISTFCNALPLHLIEGKVFLKVKPGTMLYVAKSADRSYLINPNMEHRRVFNIQNSDSLCLSKGGKVKAVAHANLNKNFLFDSYLVQYKGEYWFVRSQQVLDNNTIEEANDQLTKRYDIICHDASKAKQRFDSSLNFHKLCCQDSLSLYETEWQSKAKFNDSILAISQKRVDSLILKEQKKINANYDNWYNKLSISSKKALKLIAIKECRLSSPNSVGGCSLHFSYENMSGKVIKYIYTTIVTYNAVNDLVSCRIRDTFMFNGVSTGPVYPNASRSEVYENIIYNHSAHHAKLIDMKIVYMDGTSFIANEVVVRDLLNIPHKQIPFDVEVEANKIKHQAERNLKPIYRSLAKADLWTKRLGNLKHCRFTYDNAELVQDYNYNEVYSILSTYQKQAEEQEARRSLFEENNLISLN